MKAQSTVWLDSNGFTRIGLIRSNTGAATIAATVAASSNASIAQQWEGTVVNTTPTPTAAVYRSGAVVAGMDFLCADGTIAQVQVFAPSLALLMADQRTVDPASVLAAAIIGASIGNLESASGSLAVSYIGGIAI